jgi:GTP-binding protein
VVAYRDYKSFVMADIPGINRGARPRSRTWAPTAPSSATPCCFLHVISCDSPDIDAEYKVLIGGLEQLTTGQEAPAVHKSDMD